MGCVRRNFEGRIITLIVSTEVKTMLEMSEDGTGKKEEKKPLQTVAFV